MSPADDAPRAALVSVGDELLLGRTVDTNAAWLARFLAERGVPVVDGATVPDDEAAIGDAVGRALRLAELVLTTGGLGPTPDDVTREAVAGLLGRPLVDDPDVLERIRARFRAAGHDDVPATNLRVARVPEGARTLSNPRGTAPGLTLETGGRAVVVLPGVPGEMRAIVETSLDGELVRLFGTRVRPIHTRELHTTGIAESALAARLEEAGLALPGRVRLAFLPDRLGVDLRLSCAAARADEVAASAPGGARAELDRAEEMLEPLLAPWRFHAPSGDLAEAVLAALRAEGLTLGAAESCTGGLVAERLTRIAGASDVVLGCVVAYADEAKEGLLDVPPELIEAHGAVSGEVARAMAEGAARVLQAPAAVSVTGVAGPGGGTPEKPVGTVWMAARLPGRIAVRRMRFPGDREEVRARSAQAVLFLLLGLIDGRVPPDPAPP